MANVSIKIQNIAEIRAAFARSPIKMAKNLNEAIKKAGLAVQRQSMINSPVATGRLRASHQTTYSNLQATIIPKVDYAIYVHQGTRYMQARPFLLEAVESESHDIQGYFKKAVQDTLDDIAKETKL